MTSTVILYLESVASCGVSGVIRIPPIFCGGSKLVTGSSVSEATVANSAPGTSDKTCFEVE